MDAARLLPRQPDAGDRVKRRRGSTVQLWDVASGQLKATMKDAVRLPFAFSPDSRTLATASYNATTKLRRCGSGTWRAASSRRP